MLCQISKKPVIRFYGEMLSWALLFSSRVYLGLYPVLLRLINDVGCGHGALLSWTNTLSVSAIHLFYLLFYCKKSASSMNCLNLVLESLYLHFPFSQAEETSTTSAQYESGTQGSGSSLIHAQLYFISWRQWHPTPVLLPGNSHE